MGKKRAAVMAGRAWKLLSLALLWARKGRAFKPDRRLVPDYLRGSDTIRYDHREFSFDETPVFHLKLNRPWSMRMLRLPCLNPPVIDGDVDIFFGRTESVTRLRQNSTNREAEEEEEEEVMVDCGGEPLCKVGKEGEEEEKCIDLKAEEFIAKFYTQMKLQRQVSLLQYNDMLLRISS